MMDMMDGMMSGGWIAMLLGFLLILILIAAVVLGVVYLARRPGDGGDQTSRSGNRSVDILRERYARGEIDREEFEERSRALQS